MTIDQAAPVSQSERIVLLDSLRGIAILGILLMNIPGFGLPEPVYRDPSVLNEWGSINFNTWYFIEFFPEGSQRALFSMLFGAGIILFLSRQEKKNEGLWPADYFFRRQLWLLVFGLFNAYVLLWMWDILFHYACIGMIMFTFRRLSPKGLLIAAFICLLLQTVRENVDIYRDKKVITKGELIAKIDTTVTKLTDQQKEELGAMTGFKEKSTQKEKLKKMEKSTKSVRGDYLGFYEYQSERSFRTEVFYLYYMAWDILLFMFLGMAFYKTGIIQGQASSKIYWVLFVGGLGIGLLLSYFRLKPLIDYKFNEFDYIKNVQFEFYELSRAFRSIGIFGLIMLLYKSGWFKWFFALLRPVGQMAFTNYLMQSLLVGLFFYGVGFGMFGKLERYEIYYVVGGTWLLQIIWSHIWLRFFRFGPLEWCWRSLTYWKRQPFVK
ncbi:DUF418 domain-containing protein [Lacibacter sediminis]|uniref:DUF418 domain-containing protein n=1 Tax=Lacibacter sediminis TaxID=2760713 RepID=A0A7G5XGV8_9BACT|nr:DUF418 domain-containing protein [Lacibacter sediminis]QNA44711.1 DUF418 domain-containing protein [Lacibacter sediminis]